MNYFIIGDFGIRSNNRGTAALGYGAVEFLLQKGYIKEGDEMVKFSFYLNPFKKRIKVTEENLDIFGVNWKQKTIKVFLLEKILLKYNLHFFRSIFKSIIKKIKVVAAINGGDGLTDIYGDYMLYARLRETILAADFHIPYIILPQTIGPFQKKENMENIIKVLRGAEKVFVRDHNFDSELNKNKIPYENTNDLSFYMKPIPFSIEIKHPAVGVNLSGLAYSNKFGNLDGQFNSYPLLIESLIKNFRQKGINVYLIPHSYNIHNPEENNDDMLSTREFYDKLNDKTGVYFIDMDLISPQIKYVISQMDYFVGTRMHANFAAIFTNTPVFGLAYSYKFEGAFTVNGLKDSTYMINNMEEEQISVLIDKINKKFNIA